MQYSKKLQELWKNTILAHELTASMRKNFHHLLQEDTSAGVKRTFLLIMAYGEEGLCEILHLNEGQIELQKELNIKFSNLLEKKIILTVCNEHSLWREVYDSGCFRKIIFRSRDYISGAQIPARIRTQLLHESLRCVNIPPGTFQMGAIEGDS